MNLKLRYKYKESNTRTPREYITLKCKDNRKEDTSRMKDTTTRERRNLANNWEEDNYKELTAQEDKTKARCKKEDSKEMANTTTLIQRTEQQDEEIKL